MCPPSQGQTNKQGCKNRLPVQPQLLWPLPVAEVRGHSVRCTGRAACRVAQRGRCVGRDSRTKDGITKEKLSLCVRSWSAGSENGQAIKSNKREFYDIVYFYGVRYQKNSFIENHYLLLFLAFSHLSVIHSLFLCLCKLIVGFIMHSISCMQRHDIDRDGWCETNVLTRFRDPEMQMFQYTSLKRDSKHPCHMTKVIRSIGACHKCFEMWHTCRFCVWLTGSGTNLSQLYSQKV